MRVEGEGVIQVTGTSIVTGTGTGKENVIGIVKGLVTGMAGVEMGEGIGDPEMEEMEVEIGTVIAVGHVLLVGMVTGGLLEVQLTNISGLCR